MSDESLLAPHPRLSGVKWKSELYWSCCQVLLERLRNEITRLTAVKAFASIAQSPLSLDLSPVLEPLLAELTGFLRKANRVLRQASLSALEVPSLHSTGCLLAISLVSGDMLGA